MNHVNDTSASGSPDADVIQRALRELNRPSPQFLKAAQDIGQRAGLDADRIIAGVPLQLEGFTFWITHHGQRDPDGLILAIHMGTLTPELENSMLRQMLEHNALHPAATVGYFALLPGSDTQIYHLRIDLAKSADPSESVLTCMGSFATQADRMRQFAAEGADIIRRALEGEAADAQAGPVRP